jgi:hypothetical protein
VPDPDRDGQLVRLRRFRRAVYDCFTGWPDTLFETSDALLCSSSKLESLPYLSVRPELRRGHGSIYAALAKGGIDTAALGRVLASAIQPEFGLIFAVDATAWPRPDAVISPGRILNYESGKGEQSGRAVAGWSVQWLAQIGLKTTSWVVPVDIEHLGPDSDATLVAVTQIRRLLIHLQAAGITQAPIVALDAGYSPAGLGVHLAEDNVHIVVRIRADSVLLCAPPSRPSGSPGRPRQHGPQMKLIDPSTWPEPDQHDTRPATDTHPELHITTWHNLHLRPSRTYHEPGHDHPKTNRRLVHGHLIRIHSANPRHKTMWLWWTGPADTIDPNPIWRAYLRRFGIEHFFRFGKQHLGATTPRLRTPTQAQRWTWLVAAAYTQLVLARNLTHIRLLPWERHQPISPHRVKRGFSRLRHHLGTPTQPPQTSTPGPGRPPRHPNQHKHPRYTKIKKPTG